MISELHVSNYRSLGRSVSLSLKPMSVLIGPNGSGKSNLLDVLSFVRDAVLLGLPAAVNEREGIDSVRRRSHGAPFDVSIDLKARLPGGTAAYGFVITGDRLEEYRVKSEQASMSLHHEGVVERSWFVRTSDSWKGPDGLAPRVDAQSLALTSLGGDARFKQLVDYLSQIMIYAIFPDTLRRPQRFDPVRPMRRHGENWVSILREMVRKQGAQELVTGLAKLTGDIEDIKVTQAAGYLVAEFKQKTRPKKGKKWFNAGQQSDGTLRVAGLLTALLQAPALPVVGIEEPELTVHPGALPMLCDFLRQANVSSQILITTHSPHLLDLFDLEETAFFAVQRLDGATRVEAVTESLLEPVRNNLMTMGELYFSDDIHQTLFDFPATA